MVPIPEWMAFLQEDIGIELAEKEKVLQHSITGALLVEWASEEKLQELLRKEEQGDQHPPL